MQFNEATKAYTPLDEAKTAEELALRSGASVLFVFSEQGAGALSPSGARVPAHPVSPQRVCGRRRSHDQRFRPLDV
jgi:hypothetical protein